MALQEART